MKTMPSDFLSLVERTEGLKVEGFAVSGCEPLLVRAERDGETLATARADIIRPDLAAQGVGNGPAGFVLRLPLALADGREHTLRILLEDGRELTGSPVHVAWPARGLRTVLRQVASTVDGAFPEAADLLLRTADIAGALEGHTDQRLDFSQWPAYRDLLLPHLLDALRAQHPGPARPVRVVLLPEQRGASPALPAAREALCHLSPAPLQVVQAPEDPAALWHMLGCDASAPVLLLPADARLHPQALEAFALALDAAPLVYSDHEPNTPGAPPHLKPAWDHDLFLSTAYAGPVFGLRAGLLRDVPHGLAWADMPFLLLERLMDAPPAHLPLALYAAAPPVPDEAAANRHLARMACGARTTRTGNSLRVDWPLPPGVSLSCIIPSRDRPDLLSGCLESLRGLTVNAPPLEIIIADNGSTAPEALALLSRLAATPGVSVLSLPGPFNYSALVNAAARAARGSVLALLNDDLVFPTVPQGFWLRHVLGHFSRPDVGVVGVKLLYPDGMVQHAGMTLGADGGAVHAFRRCAADDPGFMGLAAATRHCSAVTGACLFTPRALFEKLGGLDERELPVTLNDVDYCLRAARLGLKTLLTPHAWAWHLESASRGHDDTPRKADRAKREQGLFAARWQGVLENDPCYHPLLNRQGAPFEGLRLPLPVTAHWAAPR